MMAKKQCATADELFADKQAKERSFKEVDHPKITESLLRYFHSKVPPVTFATSLYACIVQDFYL
eukprot:593651-Ditylum_brightwellii.AAC.1